MLKRFIIVLLICSNFSSFCLASNLDAKNFCNSGLKKFEIENYTSAVEDYNKALQLEPNNYDAYLKRGECKSGLKDYNGAIQDYTKAIQINATDYKAYLNRGNSKLEQKDYSGAIDDLNKAINLNSNAEMAYLNRSACKNELKDFKGAEQDKKRFDQLTPYFKPYIKNINKIVKSNWDPPYKQSGTIILQFNLHKNGRVSDITLIQSSGILQNDESAINTLRQSAPLPPLPNGFHGNSLTIRFHFTIKVK